VGRHDDWDQGRDPPNDYPREQAKSMTRIVILCCRGESLSSHSRQDNKSSIATVSEILSRSIGDPTPQLEVCRSVRGSEAQGRRRFPRLLRYCCETVERPVTDDPGMTDPGTGHLTDSGPATDQNRTPCRQASMSPCQQSVINPFENPVSRVPSSFENTVHWNDSESTGSR